VSEPIFAGLSVRLQGHLKIYEYNSPADYQIGKSRVLLDKRNAIHKDNASILIANSITHRTQNHIAYLVLGNGGSTLDTTGTVTLNTPNVTGLGQNIYNPVLFHLVDDTAGSLAGNAMSVRHINGALFSDMEIRCMIDRSEPFGQKSAFDIEGINLSTEQFKFDEIGLKLKDGTLATHVTFVPILKTASTLVEIVYTIRIAISVVDLDPIIPPPPTPFVRFIAVGAQ
jgi:hypothetical protein